MALRKLIASAGVALATLGAAAAQDAAPASLRADPFSALVGKRKPAAERAIATSAVERFVVATDDRVFLFQSDDRAGRLKFLCGDSDRRIDCAIDEIAPAEEIHLVTPSRASRGDIIWRNAEGEMLLRVAAYGGVTIFWPGEARGQAASKSFGEDPALALDPADLATARRRAQRATALVSARTGAPIVFDIGEPDADADGGARVLADAVVRAAKGVSAVADDPTGARVIAARLKRVAFEIGRPPDVFVRKDALVVIYDPTADIHGRPSSARIERLLEDAL